MKRARSSRRSSTKAEAGSAKRQKKYCSREIPWSEQRRYGGQFRFVGEGSWPISAILDERGDPLHKQYLVEWLPTPQGEEFRPTWEPHTNVDNDSISEWQLVKKKREQEKSVRPAARQHRAKRVIPDSSGDGEATEALVAGGDSAELPSTPGLDSGSSVSGIETSEIQYPIEPLTIKLPGLPADKEDYETLRSSQLEQSSPDHRITITSSQSQPSSADVLHSQHSRLSFAPSTVSESQPTQQPKHLSPKVTSSTVKQRSKLGRFVEPATEVPETISCLSISQETYPQLTAEHVSGAQQGRSPRPTSLLSHRLASPFSYDLPSISSIPASLSMERPSIADSLLPTMASRGLDFAAVDGDSHVRSPLANHISIDDLPSDIPLFPDTGDHDALVLPTQLTIQQSIEDEVASGTDTSQLTDSKATSSQESFYEREIETVDGVMIPAFPILGPNEYALPMPAEGKTKSAYDETIKVKKKSINRFIARKGAPGTAEISSKKTEERNEMLAMIERLNQITNHIDLGLPGTQPSDLKSQENAAYAEYAGSKFTFLGHLVDRLLTQDCSIAVFTQAGSLQDLVEEYLNLKNITVRRHNGMTRRQNQNLTRGLSIDLFATRQSEVTLTAKPLFLLAFDNSFATSDEQVQLLRRLYGDDLPIFHLLVTNSIEHIEKCIPAMLTSNLHLRIMIRSIYLASSYLGGMPTWVQDESDQPLDRPMNTSDLQRAVRKSPDRRLAQFADDLAEWTLSGAVKPWNHEGMPELKLDQLVTPPKISRAASRTPQPGRGRTATPVSRATTPLGRKRLHDADSDNGSKRQRLTPMRDLLPEHQRSPVVADKLQEARRQVAQLKDELIATQDALTKSEQQKDATQIKAQEWRDAHADVLRRSEHSKQKQKELSEENRQLIVTLTSLREKDEKMRAEKATLRQEIADLKVELTAAREDLKSTGGDVEQLELAREEARNATIKMQSAEKSLKTVRGDFEFTRTQYQDASKRAVDLASELREQEGLIEKLKVAAGDSRRALKAMNYEASMKKMLAQAEKNSLMVRSRDMRINRLETENAQLKTKRGVQTRGSSAQPPGTSPVPRSRQASPAHTLLVPPSGSRASVLRNER